MDELTFTSHQNYYGKKPVIFGGVNEHEHDNTIRTFREKQILD